MTEKIKMTLDELIPFFFSGKAQFSIVHKERTLHVRVEKKRLTTSEFLFFVYLRRSWVNSGWHLAGTIKGYDIFNVAASLWDAGKPATALDPLFYWIEKVIKRRTSVKNVYFYHHDICGRCGRSLYKEKSVLNGFGPECWKYVQLWIDTSKTRHNEAQTQAT